MNVKNLLQNYNRKKAEIVILEAQILAREDDIIHCDMGMAFDKISVTTSRSINSATEDTVIELIEDKETKYMETLIRKHKAENEIVDRLMATLLHRQRELLKMYYMDKESMKDIACKLDRIESTLHKSKRKSIKRMQEIYSNTVKLP